MTPTAIDDGVLALVERIVPGGSPIYLPVRPVPYARVLECFDNVDEKVRRDGGTRQLGWQLWRGRFLTEAEFHAVWCSPVGGLHDITPKPANVQSILFLPDPSAAHDGSQVDNVRHNHSGNPLINDFITAKEAVYRMQNKGERAQLKEFTISDQEAADTAVLNGIMLMTELMASAELSTISPCLCKSGQRYADCHAVDLATIVARI